MLKKRQLRRMSNSTRSTHDETGQLIEVCKQKAKPTNKFTQLRKIFAKTVLNQRKISQNSCLYIKGAHIGFRQ